MDRLSGAGSQYSEHYNTLFEWIFEKKWNVSDIPLRFNDFSIPKDNPIHSAPTSEILREAIFQEIAKSNVVVIPTGMYANYSDWIQKEIRGANLYQKPILAVDPWGQTRTSSMVKDNASKVVGWTSQSVVDGIWKLYNGRR